MPGRTRKLRKKAVCPPSAASRKKFNAIAVDTGGESLDSLLNDFGIQTTTLTKQALKQFEKQAKQMLTALPMKSSIPKEVLKMEISEFIRRGGSFQSAWDSLKHEKFEKQNASAKLLLDCAQSSACSSSLEAVQHKSQAKLAVLDGGPQDYVTPAQNTRRAAAKREQITVKRKPKPLEEVKVQDFSNASGFPVNEKFLLQDGGPQDYITPAQNTRRAAAKKEQITVKRKPKPLEEVKVQAFSNASGSPVDEKILLQLHKEELLGNIQEQLMEATAKFPQKWRSKLITSFREMKKTQDTSSDDVLITPAIRR